jgi:hypothetical protein
MTEQLDLSLGEPVKFYLYDQNNSGGSFVYDDNFGENVLIEARSSGEANQKMQDMGCWEHGSCSCCGDRWSSIYDGDEYNVFATAEEVIARSAPDPDAKYSFEQRGRQLVIHYLDGRVEWHNREVEF